MSRPLLLPQGAEVVASGVRYCVWAPAATQVAAQICEPSGTCLRSIPLFKDMLGYHHGVDGRGRAGDLYKIQLGRNASYPCPASRWQPYGVGGPSLVVDPRNYVWRDDHWRRPAFRDLIFYELHIGTFTREGTFAAAATKIPYLRELGINAIEIMPVADFPGTHNWGYDGVRLFAPARAYGRPDDLRALVETAHAHNIAVILDVVYNHFGPDGNYLAEFSAAYFDARHPTPWGAAINFSGPDCGPVRAYFLSNILYWMEEFHIDGFRLDATHAIVDTSPKHILEELGEVVHGRGGFLIAEDERNEGRLVSPKSEGGYGLDAAWADDFHHSLEVAVTDGSLYRDCFAGERHELVELLEHGWFYRGKPYGRSGKIRGTACAHLPPERFVFCISNHDQVGNRPYGERLHQLVSAASYRAASGLLCLTPYTPLLFMGQEWAADSPFLYFTDHNEELGQAVEEGRRREFAELYGGALATDKPVPLPQDPQSFERSKLDWQQPATARHQECLTLYRELLALRKAHDVFRPRQRGHTLVAELSMGVIAIRARNASEDFLVLCDLSGGHRGLLAEEEFCGSPAGWAQVLSSEETRFGGEGRPSFEPRTQAVEFAGPELLVLRTIT